MNCRCASQRAAPGTQGHCMIITVGRFCSQHKGSHTAAGLEREPSWGAGTGWQVGRGGTQTRPAHSWQEKPSRPARLTTAPAALPAPQPPPHCGSPCLLLARSVSGSPSPSGSGHLEGQGTSFPFLQPRPQAQDLAPSPLSGAMRNLSSHRPIPRAGGEQFQERGAQRRAAAGQQSRGEALHRGSLLWQLIRLLKINCIASRREAPPYKRCRLDNLPVKPVWRITAPGSAGDVLCPAAPLRWRCPTSPLTAPAPGRVCGTDSFQGIGKCAVNGTSRRLSCQARFPPVLRMSGLL